MKVKLQRVEGVGYVHLPVPEDAIPRPARETWSRFSPELRREIKRKRKDKVRLKVLAYEYGTSIGHIRRLLAKTED